jgi:hypothetical protein
MRELGFTTNCPLIAIATGPGAPEVRARAAATAVRAFADPRGRDAFVAAFSSAPPLERQTIRTEANAICPELIAQADLAVPTTEAPISVDLSPPRASIVIPCRDNAEGTLGCLQALQTTTDPGLYEVILVDNGSTDATVNLARIQGARFRVIRNEDDNGFLSACNQGAAVARGEYVLFLGKTKLSPGWLEPLMTTLDEDPTVITVETSESDPAGRVTNTGVPESSDLHQPRFVYPQPLDYASEVCLLVRRNAFNDVGGFDDRYATAR